MRWRFLDSNCPEERQHQKRTLAAIEAWWAEFRRQAEQLENVFQGDETFNVAQWIRRHLDAISPGLMWEFGPAVSGAGHRLVITPEGRHHLRPLTATILSLAPELPRWEFYGYRLPEDVEMAEKMVEVRKQRSLDGWGVSVMLGDYGLIDLEYQAEEITGPADSDAFDMAFIATETLLGEQWLDQYVGTIGVAKRSASTSPDHQKPQRLLPLDRLHDTVRALINSQLAQQPDQPYFRWAGHEDVKWSMLQREPEEQEVYAGWDDLFVAMTMAPQVWLAAHSRRPFVSHRFSRHGETFAYLKIDGTNGLNGTGFDDRGEMEAAVNDVLTAAETGCVIGGGTGWVCSYIELALLDIEAAVAAMADRLGSQLAARTWLLFHDSDWSAEWIGLSPATPPPPTHIEAD